MKNIFAFVALSLFPLFVLAISPAKLVQLITGDAKIMAAVDAKIVSILPSLKMKFVGIELETMGARFNAIVTYTDTAKGTLLNPRFGNCSVLLQGRIINESSITVDTIKENDCGE
jgi:hypothetical protein